MNNQNDNLNVQDPTEESKQNDNKSGVTKPPVAEDISDNSFLSALANGYEWIGKAISSVIKFVLSGRRNRVLRKLHRTADAVMALRSSMMSLTEEELKAKTQEFKDRLSNGETLDDILIEAFAVGREAARRVLGEEHYKVQIMGGVALHMGMIAEMKTGEGKTLVSVLPAYLNALEGKGVHVITVNDYLARRDSEWMGTVFEFLGLTVGCIDGSGDQAAKQRAYAADITYCTNNEVGFDYLRDNMAMHPSQVCQRPFNFCIIDEADSILIDEARTPLIISGERESPLGFDNTLGYKFANKIIGKLEPEHYKFSIKEHQANFTEAGLDKLEELIDESYKDKDSWGQFSIDTLESILTIRGRQPILVKTVNDHSLSEIAHLLDQNGIIPIIIQDESDIDQSMLESINNDSVIALKYLDINKIISNYKSKFSVIDSHDMDPNQVVEAVNNKSKSANILIHAANNANAVKIQTRLEDSGIQALFVQDEDQLDTFLQTSNDRGVFIISNPDISHIIEHNKGKIFIIDGYGAKDYLYSAKNSMLLHHLTQALKANLLYRNGIDYIVDRKKDGDVRIVDEHTGRILYGRRYSEGLHQALEAKEMVRIRPESKTVASITFQKLFSLYPKKSGMTGTAMTESDEFEKTFSNIDPVTGQPSPLYCIDIPTNVAVKRIDHNDLVFRSKLDKMAGIIEQVKICQEKSQPVIVGTLSVESSEEVAQYLRRAGFNNMKVLNAKNHKEEANIIANAGRSGSITIVTNMAGRGTDILLGGGFKVLLKQATEGIDDLNRIAEIASEIRKDIAQDKAKVLAAGGLYVISVEHNNNRRIDNQLKGRAGRQGDPGEFICFVCPEDDLFSKFDFGSRLEMIMEEGEKLQFNLLTKMIESLQKRTEGYHFEIRQSLKRYSDVKEFYMMNFYSLRSFILQSDQAAVSALLRGKFAEVLGKSDSYLSDFVRNYALDVENLEEAVHLFDKIMDEGLSDQSRLFGDEIRQIALVGLDEAWQKYFIIMSHAREAISFQRYAQKDDLVAFEKIAKERFDFVLDQAYINIFGNIVSNKNKRTAKYKNVTQDFNAQMDERIHDIDFIKSLQEKFKDIATGLGLDQEANRAPEHFPEEFKPNSGPSVEEMEARLQELMSGNKEFKSFMEQIGVKLQEEMQAIRDEIDQKAEQNNEPEPELNTHNPEQEVLEITNDEIEDEPEMEPEINQDIIDYADQVNYDEKSEDYQPILELEPDPETVLDEVMVDSISEDKSPTEDYPGTEPLDPSLADQPVAEETDPEEEIKEVFGDRIGKEIIESAEEIAKALDPEASDYKPENTEGNLENKKPSSSKKTKKSE